MSSSLDRSGAITPQVMALIVAAIAKYRPYKFGMKYFVGEYILERLQKILVDPSLLDRNRILTSDVFYDLRPTCEANGIDVTSTEAIMKKKRRHKIQNEYILQICRDLGIRRRHAGIITGDTGYLYFRGERYAVSLDKLDTLKTKGTDIVIIGKQGIAEKLRYKSDNYGIALVSTRGFLTENALDLSELADINGAKNAILTDNDISGKVIAANAPYPRIGINNDTLDYFGIRDRIRDLEEVYHPNPQHLQHIVDNRQTKFKDLTASDLNYLQEKRIEIHAVLNYAGEDEFWEWILRKLNEISSTRDYNRAIIIPKPYTFRSDSVWRVTHLYDNRLASIVKPLTKQKKRKLSVYYGFIEDVEGYETEVKEEFEERITNDTNTDIAEFSQDLDKIITKYDNDEYEEYNPNTDEDTDLSGNSEGNEETG
jgi:hypothetical protein